MVKESARTYSYGNYEISKAEINQGSHLFNYEKVNLSRFSNIQRIHYSAPDSKGYENYEAPAKYSLSEISESDALTRDKDLICSPSALNRYSFGLLSPKADISLQNKLIANC